MSDNLNTLLAIWLPEHGYDGLCHEDCGCACESPNLSPGCCMTEECMPGHKRPPVADDDCELCPCEWHMVPGPREVKP
jgi:hypothetical protein